MIRRFRWALAAVVAVAAGAAEAATYRQPQDGRPAVVIDAPDSWTVSRSGPMSMNLLNAGHNGVISISIETVPEGFSLDTFRDNYVKAASCPLTGRTETVRVAGRPAGAFYCQPTQGPLAPARVVLLQIDPTHVLSVGHSYRLDANGAAVQELETAIASIRLEP